MFAWLLQIMADHRLPSAAFKVAFAIGQHINRVSGEAWPSIERIAKLIGMSKGTVHEMVRRLENHGHIDIDPGAQGRGHSNHYRLLLKVQPTERLRDGKDQRAELSVPDQKVQLDAAKGQHTDSKGQPADMNLTNNHHDEPSGSARGARSPATEIRKNGAASDYTVIEFDNTNQERETKSEDMEEDYDTALDDDDKIPF